VLLPLAISTRSTNQGLDMAAFRLAFARADTDRDGKISLAQMQTVTILLSLLHIFLIALFIIT
jgi:hypothetical protein